MRHRTHRSTVSALASQRNAQYALDIAIAAPQVMALRLARVMAAGPQPGRRDRNEMVRMWTEKVQAFAQAWTAMAVEAWLYPARLGAAIFGSAFALTPIPLPNPIARALMPVRRTVRANHRRLTRRRAT